MAEVSIDITCPQCGCKFQVPVGEALAPIIESEVVRRVNLETQETTAQIRASAQKESDERNHSVLAAKEKLIADLRIEIDALRRKADSGAQLLAGEAQEIELESMLRTAFPSDRIVPVEKGRVGADIIQHVSASNGCIAGAILWESKNTRTWSKDWVAKIKNDMREAKAALCVIATSALPKGVETFDRIDGTFVASLRCVLPLAEVLRHVLIEIATIRAASTHDDGAAEKLFAYVAGDRFRQRLTAVVEASIALQADLDSDKRTTSRRWARTQQHIDRLVLGVGAIYGELQAAAGSLPEVPGLTGEGTPDAA